MGCQFNVLCVPGTILGAVSTDYIGLRLSFTVGAILQGWWTCTFVCYSLVKTHISESVVMDSIFATLGEFVSGDNVIVLISKRFATLVRG